MFLFAHRDIRFEMKEMSEYEAAAKQVPMEKAFYFFNGLGSYTGKSATSLKEFMQNINEVDEKSLRFHLERGDFENWTKEVLKDADLARQIKQLHEANLAANELRSRLYATISKRVSQMTRPQTVQKVSRPEM